MNSEKSHFSDLAYLCVVKEKGAVLKDLAQEMGLTYASLYARLRGRVPFRPEEIQVLVRVVPDPRLVAFLLDASPFIAVPRIEASNPPNVDTLMDEAIQALGAGVSMIRSLEHGARSGSLDADGLKEVNDRLTCTESLLATLRTHLRWVEGRRPPTQATARQPVERLPAAKAVDIN